MQGRPAGRRVSNIHPDRAGRPKAELDSSVSVGPYTVIGPHVKIDVGTTVVRTALEGHTTIGRDNSIFQFVSGAINQDKKYAASPCELVIGILPSASSALNTSAIAQGGGDVAGQRQPG